jgi:hypothetical protein
MRLSPRADSAVMWTGEEIEQLRTFLMEKWEPIDVHHLSDDDEDRASDRAATRRPRIRMFRRAGRVLKPLICRYFMPETGLERVTLGQ